MTFGWQKRTDICHLQVSSTLQLVKQKQDDRIAYLNRLIPTFEKLLASMSAAASDSVPDEGTCVCFCFSSSSSSSSSFCSCFVLLSWWYHVSVSCLFKKNMSRCALITRCHTRRIQSKVNNTLSIQSNVKKISLYNKYRGAAARAFIAGTNCTHLRSVQELEGSGAASHRHSWANRPITGRVCVASVTRGWHHAESRKGYVSGVHKGRMRRGDTQH